MFFGKSLGTGYEEFGRGALEPGAVDVHCGFAGPGGTLDCQLGGLFFEVYLVLPQEEVVMVVDFYLFAEEFVRGFFFSYDEVDMLFEEASFAFKEGAGLIERPPFRDHEFEKTRLINSYRDILRPPASPDRAIDLMTHYLDLDRSGVMPHRVFL